MTKPSLTHEVTGHCKAHGNLDCSLCGSADNPKEPTVDALLGPYGMPESRALRSWRSRQAAVAREIGQPSASESAPPVSAPENTGPRIAPNEAIVRVDDQSEP